VFRLMTLFPRSSAIVAKIVISGFSARIKENDVDVPNGHHFDHLNDFMSLKDSFLPYL
jgi:hypothetical protein